MDMNIRTYIVYQGYVCIMCICDGKFSPSLIKNRLLDARRSHTNTLLASSPDSTSAPPTTGQIIKRRKGSLVSNVARRTLQLSNVGGYYAPPTQLHNTVDNHGGMVFAHLACGPKESLSR